MSLVFFKWIKSGHPKKINGHFQKICGKNTLLDKIFKLAEAHEVWLENYGSFFNINLTDAYQ